MTHLSYTLDQARNVFETRMKGGQKQKLMLPIKLKNDQWLAEKQDQRRSTDYRKRIAV
jgi:hypothetical protein